MTLKKSILYIVYSIFAFSNLTHSSYINHSPIDELDTFVNSTPLFLGRELHIVQVSEYSYPDVSPYEYEMSSTDAPFTTETAITTYTESDDNEKSEEDEKKNVYESSATGSAFGGVFGILTLMGCCRYAWYRSTITSKPEQATETTIQIEMDSNEQPVTEDGQSSESEKNQHV